MKTALGFLLFVAVLAGVTMAIDQATAAALPGTLRPWTGLAAGLFITLGLSNIWSLARGYGQGDSSRSAMLNRARTGRPPAQDGPILATGVVRAEGATLVSPISGQPCVAYQYRIFKRVRLQQDEWVTKIFYWGYACRPFGLDTPSGVLRVLSMPRFTDDAPRHGNDLEAAAHAESYISATRFETGVAPLTLGSAVTLAEGLFTDERQEMKHDWKNANVPEDLQGLNVEEYVLPEGATASAWGMWSSERRAIVPGTLGSGAPGIAMVAGPPEDLIGSVAGPPSSATAVAIAAVVLLTLGGALAWAAQAGHIAQAWVSITS